MFTVSHIFPCRGRSALLYSNISNVYCFAYIPESGKTICALLYRYVKCLLLRMYSRLGANNMCTFIQQYFCSDPNNESDPMVNSDSNNESDSSSEYSPLGLTHVMNQYLGQKFTTWVKINCLNTILKPRNGTPQPCTVPE